MKPELTVKDLIEALSKYPDDMPVSVSGGDMSKAAIPLREDMLSNLKATRLKLDAKKNAHLLELRKRNVSEETISRVLGGLPADPWEFDAKTFGVPSSVLETKDFLYIGPLD